MPFFEKKTVSGGFVEIEQFHSPGKKIPRGVKRGETPQSHAEHNDRQSEKEFIRMLNCNFNPTMGDLFVTLTFAKTVDKAGTVKAFRNFELRAKRHCSKKKPQKVEYKRLSMIEQQGQWHIHIIVSSLTLEEINMLWGLGRVTASFLNNSNNYKDLAAYLFKSEKPSKSNPAIDNTKPPRRKFAKRWSGTRNLKKPVVTITPIKRESIMRNIPTAPKGYILLPDWVVSCDAYGHPIRRYAYIKIPGKPPNSKRKPTKPSARQNK